MTDRYERIRAAMTMGPTRGPWDGDDNSVSRLWSDGSVGIREYIALPDSAEDSEPNPANMHWIAACDPDTIRALLAERDALAAEVERLAEALRDASTSMQTIADKAGRDDYLMTTDEVRGYANSRANAARAALAKENSND